LELSNKKALYYDSSFLEYIVDGLEHNTAFVDRTTCPSLSKFI